MLSEAPNKTGLLADPRWPRSAARHSQAELPKPSASL